MQAQQVADTKGSLGPSFAVTQYQPPTGVVLELSGNEETMGIQEMFKQKEVP